MEERRLARAGRADDGDKLSALNRQIDAAQRLDVDLADPVNLAQIADQNDGRIIHRRAPRSDPSGRRAVPDRARRGWRRRGRSRRLSATRPDRPPAAEKPERTSAAAI